MVHITADAARAVLFGSHIALIHAARHKTLGNKTPADFIFDPACRAVLRILVVNRHGACNSPHIDVSFDDAFIPAGLYPSCGDGIKMLIVHILIKLLDA